MNTAPQRLPSVQPAAPAIRFIRPSLPEVAQWSSYLAPAYEGNWFSNFGPVHQRFAKALTDKYGQGRRVAVPVASATAGLTAVLEALDIQGRVVVPSFTFVATAQAVLQAGCTPVFCDVDPDTWTLSRDGLRACLAGGDIAAVMPVRAYGFGQDLAPLGRICRAAGVPMIVDAAAALGGRLPGGDWIGGQGCAEVFSLHATKVFGIGEGGVMFCPPDLARGLRRALNFGLDRGDVVSRGGNGKLSEFAAAVGLAVLERMDGFVANRNRYVARYRHRLQPLAEAGRIDLPPQSGLSPWQTLPLRLAAGQDPEQVLHRAAQRGLELRRYYFPALHRSRRFASCERPALPVTEALSDQMICLPVYSQMEAGLVDTIVDIFGDCL